MRSLKKQIESQKMRVLFCSNTKKKTCHRERAGLNEDTLSQCTFRVLHRNAVVEKTARKPQQFGESPVLFFSAEN